MGELEGAVGVGLANVDLTHFCRIVWLHSSSVRCRSESQHNLRRHRVTCPSLVHPSTPSSP
jgi:hypothetical protein